MTKRNITAGWAAIGLFLFNPEYSDIRRSPAELTVPKANQEVSYPQDQVLKEPITPVTPLIIDTLTSLHNLIQHEACALNEPGKQRIQRHVQKLASAAQISFAKQTLLQDQNRFLSKINNEAKVRRSTRSVVLGKAKVMSYEDLEEARAKRAAKEKTTVCKGQPGRKRKSPGPEAEAGAEAKVARVSKVPEPLNAPVALWRAPVAQTY